MTTTEIVKRFSDLGGFGAQLANLWYVADTGNKFLIETTWLHLFRRFDPLFTPEALKG